MFQSSLQFVPAAASRRWALASGLLAASLISACAVGPDFRRPAAPIATAYGVSGADTDDRAAALAEGSLEPQHFKAVEDLPFDWWKRFESPALNALVQRALRANPTVTAAQANLRQAQELVYAQQGYFFPTVGINYNAQRQKLAGNLGGNSP